MPTPLRHLLTCLLLCMAPLAAIADDITLPPKSIVDFHVHVAGLGYGNSGCFINKTMRDNFRFRFYLKAMGVTEKELQENGDRVLFGKISQAIAQSVSVSKAVILAMDGVIDANGNLDENATQVYVPNDYVLRETRQTSNLLYGASINPYRPDAIARLEQAKRDGVILVKWLPSIMYIDPADERIIPFYRKMAELHIPLLTHTGMEKSFAGARDELADPLRLKLPLSLGVTVIAAHIATTGESEGQDNFERILPLFTQYPNLYADISSLTQVNKLGYMKKALAEPRLNGRLIYGTDWPLQFFPLVSAWYQVDMIGVKNAIAIGKIDNQWDRDVALKIAMGVDRDTLARGQKLFLTEQESAPDETP